MTQSGSNIHRHTLTAIFGGSFNPFHNAHLTLGRELVGTGSGDVALPKSSTDSFTVEELWFLVSPQNPLKRNSALLDENIRLQLARLAVKDEPHLYVSDYEFHLPRPSYMVHTLAGLRRDFPDREFALVMGADNWLNFHRWYKPQEIMDNHRILVYPRPGCELGELPQGVQLIHTALSDISSTMVRQLIARGDYDGRHLPPAVWEAIKQKKLYWK